jgi:hypothetical protein
MTGITTDLAAYTSSSFTPDANQLIVVSFSSTQAASTDPSTVTVSNSGTGLTWTLVSEFLYKPGGTTRCRLSIYAAKAPASPVAMTVTGTYSAAITGCIINAFQVTGSNVATGSVASCFVQTVPSSASAVGTSASVTLAAPAQAKNRPFLVVAHTANEDTTAQTGWTEIADNGITLPVQALQVQWRSAIFDTATGATWTTSTNYGAVAMEIKAQ